MKELLEGVTTQLAKLGKEDDEGNLALWNSIENERFKIMFVDKDLMRQVGFTDASVQFHNDRQEQEEKEGEDNE